MEKLSVSKKMTAGPVGKTKREHALNFRVPSQSAYLNLIRIDQKETTGYFVFQFKCSKMLALHYYKHYKSYRKNYKLNTLKSLKVGIPNIQYIHKNPRRENLKTK